jgi:uncharacterized membrane protein YfcA
MTTNLIAVLAGLGAIGGFFAGLLGFGGGVVMFPLLYYVPPLFGLAPLEAKTVAAVVVSQVFFSALIGGLAHLRRGRVHARIALPAGISSSIGAFAGGIVSKWTSEEFLLLLFGIVTLLVGMIMFLPVPQHKDEDPRRIAPAMVPLASYSLVGGTVVGFLGAGNFAFVPLLIYVLKVPTRIAIGSSLFIALMNSTAGFVGKLATGQIPLLLSGLVVGGAAAGALLGEKIHRLVPARTLRAIYALLVALIALRVWMTIWHDYAQALARSLTPTPT